MSGLRAKIGHSLLAVPAVAAVTSDRDGRLLLIQRADTRQWALPAGAVEPDEAPEQALVREVREETGLLVEPIALLGVEGGPDYRVEYENGDLASYVVAIYECRMTGGMLCPDGDETLDARFFTRNELRKLDMPVISHAILGIAMRHASFAKPS